MKNYFSQNQVKEIITSSNGAELIVCFFKKDGSWRRMVCRLGEGGDDDRINLYDVEHKGYRGIYYGSIFAVVLGEEIFYNMEVKVD